ncbi:uncharacterized protein DUF2505 [Georgenia soli]|uniref:Uncharacterized protein DUF2505 n=1 Tax=Georgenia soli TaxID=638953 RepID=A0A2A9EPB2_9MICO|nr:DUF2505 domain-containing protein [Georgenia soli]PFG40758.1 uncharacterized protein DUF2505 [Georgenia soli]
MRFTATTAYPADVETVAAMLSTREFVERKMTEAGALSTTCEVVRDGAAFTVTTRAELPTASVPTALRSLVGDSLEVRLVEAWQAPAADGSRTATMSVDIQGVPARISGTQRLAPTMAGCEQTYDGDVSASVPLFGEPIEKAAVGTVDQVVAVERRLGLEHLAARH